MLSYLVLFSSAFLAATILPFSSEVVLFALAMQGEPGWLIIAVASLGNTLGAAVNWYLGRFLLHFQSHKWFYFSQDQLERGQRWFARYGVWSLLFAWMPIGGDALTFIAGVMKVRFVFFLILVGAGKTLRYVVVFYLANMPVLQ